MTQIVNLGIKKGITIMDVKAPGYTPDTQAAVRVDADALETEQADPSQVTVSIIGAGGCGRNWSAPFKNDPRVNHVEYFDTSEANKRPGETIHVIAGGQGSGGVRSENSRGVVNNVASLSEDELFISDVNIVQFALGSGSGSVVGPMLMREYVRRGKLAIGIAVIDTSATHIAKNVLGAFQTLETAAEQDDMYLPMIILNNDAARTRGQVNDAAHQMLAVLIEMLTRPVYEVDKNDRLFWVNPVKTTGAGSGMKILGLELPEGVVDASLLVGADSKEMVDSTLILQSEDEDADTSSPRLTRMKKVGIYKKAGPRLVGTVSSDISALTTIIDTIKKARALEASQKTQKVSFRSASGDDDIII